MSSQSPPSFPAAISRLQAAMTKVANGDTSAIKALYAHSDDATSFYGWGGYEKGWDMVSRRWDWAGRQFKGGTVSYQNVTTVVTAELAYTTDIETFKGQDGGNGPARAMVEPRHSYLPSRARRLAAGASSRQSSRNPVRAVNPAAASSQHVIASSARTLGARSLCPKLPDADRCPLAQRGVAKTRKILEHEIIKLARVTSAAPPVRSVGDIEHGSASLEHGSIVGLHRCSHGASRFRDLADRLFQPRRRAVAALFGKERAHWPARLLDGFALDFAQLSARRLAGVDGCSDGACLYLRIQCGRLDASVGATRKEQYEYDP
jgi:hypothetical protein